MLGDRGWSRTSSPERRVRLVPSVPVDDDERRKATRFAIWFPMQIASDGETIIGISRDISEVGVMMVAAAAPEVGATIAVTMALPDDEEGTREVHGTIVRVTPNDDDSEGLWRHRVAVEFQERVEELEPFLEQLSRVSVPPPAP